MSNLAAIAALDAAIATLASSRNELQKRHDETIAAVATAEALATHKPARFKFVSFGDALRGKR